MRRVAGLSRARFKKWGDNVAEKKDVLFSSYRVEEYWADIHNIDGSFVTRMENVTGGSITYSVDARIKGSGSLEISEKFPLEWWGKLIRVWVKVSNGNDYFQWCLGTFIPSIPSVDYGEGYRTYTIDLQDKLLILDQDCVANAFSIPAKAPLMPYVHALIRSASQASADQVVDPVALNYRAIHHKALTWEAGTPKLTIVNDILDALEYFSLTADWAGNYTSSPYVLPSDRPIAWTFREGQAALHRASFQYTIDRANVPNRIVYLVQEEGSSEDDPKYKWSACAENTRGVIEKATGKTIGQEYSYQARGRWITQVNDDIKADSQQELVEKVRRRLENACTPFEKVEIEHATLPLRLNDVARFQSADLAIMGTVRKFELTLQAGSLMKTAIRKGNIDDDNLES